MDTIRPPWPPGTGRVDPQARPLRLDGPGREGVDALVDFVAEPADLAFQNARSAHEPPQGVHGSARRAVDIGVLEHRREGRLDRAARLRERRETRSGPQPRDARLDVSGAALPIPIPMAASEDTASRNMTATEARPARYGGGLTKADGAAPLSRA